MNGERRGATQPSADQPSIPLSQPERAAFTALVAAQANEREHAALSRLLSHLTPSSCRFLSDMTVPRRMWRGGV